MCNPRWTYAKERLELLDDGGTGRPLSDVPTREEIEASAGTPLVQMVHGELVEELAYTGVLSHALSRYSLHHTGSISFKGQGMFYTNWIFYSVTGRQSRQLSILL